MIPDRIVHPQPHEPAEQKVELHPLHQLALGAYPVKSLQQHCPQKLLRRDRRPAEVRIEPGKVVAQILQRRVRHFPYRAKRMIAPHPRFQIYIAEKRASPFVAAPHRASSSMLFTARESRFLPPRYQLLQRPASRSTSDWCRQGEHGKACAKASATMLLAV